LKKLQYASLFRHFSPLHYALREFIENESGGVKNVVKMLFKEDTENPTLLSVKELVPLLKHNKLFDLERLQMKVENLLLRWKMAIFGDEKPTLYKLKYRVSKASEAKRSLPSVSPKKREAGAKPPPAAARAPKPTPPSVASPMSSSNKKKQSTTRAELDELRKGRAALKRDHGEDPLDESRDIARDAARATKRHRVNEDNNDEPDAAEDDLSDDQEEVSKDKKKRGRSAGFYNKKKSAQRLAFEDELEEDDEEEEQERIKLSSTPSKSSPFPKSYLGPRPDEGVFDQNGKVLKRRPWANEEKGAVKAGVRKYGLGKWVHIKEEYGVILRNRTAVQCKDCWRTMARKGEASLDDSDDDDDDDEIVDV
jgi:hypothetical protein